MSWHVDALIVGVLASPCRRGIHETGRVRCHERGPGTIVVNERCIIPSARILVMLVDLCLNGVPRYRSLDSEAGHPRMQRVSGCQHLVICMGWHFCRLGAVVASP